MVIEFIHLIGPQLVYFVAMDVVKTNVIVD